MDIQTFLASPLKDRIYATLVFFDLFDAPVTIEQLQFYLMGPPASAVEIKCAVQEDNRIVIKDNLFLLHGREEIVQDWSERQILAQQYWGKVQRYMPFIRRLPFLRVVAVCNTLAFGVPNSRSDIDLFIITKPGRIFTARVMVTLILWLLGVRRHGKKIAGRFCLSFFVSEDAMNLQPLLLKPDKNTPYDIYMVYWLRSLVPCQGQKKFQQFYERNGWINDFFSSNTTLGLPIPPTSHSSSYSWGLGGTIGNWLEKKLQHLHEKRFAKKLPVLGPESSVVISPTMLKFHNIDRRQELNQKFWQNFCNK